MSWELHTLATYQRDKDEIIERYCEHCFVNLTGKWHRLVDGGVYCSDCAYELFDRKKGLKRLY